MQTTPPIKITDCYVKHERSSNIELYRIMIMLLIVMDHYVVQSGLLDEMVKKPTAVNSMYLYIFGAWGKMGINCFVLITGYFMCQSRITLYKFLKLVLQVEFYNIILGAIFVLTGYTPFSIGMLQNILNPFNGVGRNFTGCFLLFFLFIPFLNACINNISKKQHLSLLLLCIFIYSGLGAFYFIGVEFNYVTWFCVLYILGSYIKKYPILYKNKLRFWIIATIVTTTISILSIIIFIFISQRIGLEVNMFRACYLLIDSNKPLTLVLSICLFMTFKNINIKHNKIINTIASCTFGVYLIHDYFWGMQQWLWKDICKNVAFFNSEYLYIHSIIVPIIVFFACVIIEYTRQKTIEKPLIDNVYKLLTKNTIANKLLSTNK